MRRTVAAMVAERLRDRLAEEVSALEVAEMSREADEALLRRVSCEVAYLAAQEGGQRWEN